MTATHPVSDPMTVGELSRRTGIPIKTLRAYTDQGLVYTLGRSPSNYRLFTSDALWCLHAITTLRGLGLTLAEIRGLADHADADGSTVGPRLARLLAESRRRLRARLADLQATLGRIDAFEHTHQAELAGHHPLWTGDPRAARRTA